MRSPKELTEKLEILRKSIVHGHAIDKRNASQLLKETIETLQDNPNSGGRLLSDE